MPDDGQADDENRLKGSSVSNEERSHVPSVAAVRLAQEASDLNRRPAPSSIQSVRDITREFIAASECLPPGELVKDEHFTLFEAVGALEIMDLKMDSGYVLPGDPFEPEFDPTSGLEANEVLWIMDELLRLEVTFHEGYPLSQNVFTSLHVFNLISPENRLPYNLHVRGVSRQRAGIDLDYDLVHTVLRTYCIAVVKCCQITLQLIQSQTFYEEEDFVTFLYGRELLPNLGSMQAEGLVQEAIEWLNKSSVNSDLKHALMSHLNMRLHALVCMDGVDKNQWDELRSVIAEVEGGHHLSKPIPAAFSNKVQRQLATSTPPRPMPDLSWQDACDKWQQLCSDISAAIELTSYKVRQSSHSLQNATWTFAYRDPFPNAFARAKMQEILVASDTFGDDILHFDHLLTDIRELVLAGDSLADPASFQIEVPSDPRHICSRVIEDFMSRAIGEYLNIFRMICQNRCRMRRTFTQAIPLLDEIETEARNADQQLNDVIVPRTFKDDFGTEHRLEPLTLWSRFYKLQMVTWIIQLGFETDIYLPDELSNMYMLQTDLTDRRREELSRIEQFTRRRLDGLSKSGNGAYYQECLASRDWLRGLILMADINIALASALTHLYVCLEKSGVIDTLHYPYSEPQLRYEARMKPVLNMVNDTVPTIELLEQQKATLGSTISDMYTYVTSMVSSAKRNLAGLRSMRPEQVKHVGTEEQWTDELKRLETVCVATTVATSQLLRIAKKMNDSQDGASNGGKLGGWVEMIIPPPGKRYHDWWVVPQLKERSRS